MASVTGALGEEWSDSVVQIAKNDSFPKKQGILPHGRMYLLLNKDHSYRPRRTGETKSKPIHGSNVDSNLSVLSLVIVKKKGGSRGYSCTGRY